MSNNIEAPVKYIWVCLRDAIVGQINARDIDSYIDKYELVKATPKGLRLKMRYSTTFFAEIRYHFFDTEREAYEHIAGQANATAGKLDDRKKTYVGLLCDAHDRLRKMGGQQ